MMTLTISVLLSVAAAPALANQPDQRETQSQPSEDAKTVKRGKAPASRPCLPVSVSFATSGKIEKAKFLGCKTTSSRPSSKQ